jgi:pimeloyl-ACP methyl ester carboxylesterase
LRIISINEIDIFKVAIVINYVYKPGVSDGGFITASLFEHIEFTNNILKTLEVFAPELDLSDFP